MGFFLVACHHRLFLLLRFFKLNFTLIFNLFSFFAGFFNGLHTCLHVWGQSGLNQGHYMCECSMPTSHPHSAMALQYGGIPCVYGRIPVVYGRILRV